MKMNYYVHSVITNYLISDKRISEIRTGTKDDEVLQVIIQYIQKGWTSKRKHLPTSIQSYFTHRDELSTADGIVLKGNQIVIPQILQADIRGLLHTAHLGIVKIKARARDVVYWPGINTELEEVVRCCDVRNIRIYNRMKP